MYKTHHYALASIVVLALVVIIIVQANPLRRSSEQIRRSMLKLTPIGSRMEEVLNLIGENPKWTLRHISDSSGYSLAGGRPNPPAPDELAERPEAIIGTQTIRAYLGAYGLLFQTGVSVFWGFNEDSLLIDLHVRKDTNAP